MKQYEFHSALPPEVVFARLSVRAKESMLLSPWEGARMIVYYRKRERIWLSYTGEYPISGFIPFHGRVAQEGGGSLIAGDFSWIRVVSVGAGIAFFGGLLLQGSLGFAALFAAVGFAWFSFVQWLIQKTFSKRREAVLNFIQENLLE